MDSVLDQQVMQFVRMVDDLGLKGVTTRYRFMEADVHSDLSHNDIGAGMKVYWFEILERAHIAAVTSILRSRHWLSAVLSTRTEKNALAFAAAFRGLMESAGDTTTALNGIPLALARHYPEIAISLSGSAASVSIAEELEDELIHYSHGRHIKNSEQANTPKSHKARSVHEYLKVFESLNAEKAAQCYRFLCDLTHPGATSVWMWLAAVDSKGSEFTISTEQDEAIIAEFWKLYAEVVLDVVMFAFNAPVLVLNTLNYFPVKMLHTKELLSFDLDGLAAWRKCKSELDKSGARLQTI